MPKTDKIGSYPKGYEPKVELDLAAEGSLVVLYSKTRKKSNGH